MPIHCLPVGKASMYLSIYLEDIVMTISRLWKIPTTRTGILSALPRIIKVSTGINLETAIQIRPYKEYISIKITPFLNRYISYGNTYTHTHTNAGLRGSLMAMYKNWVLMAEMNTSNHTLWGETLTKEEKLHTIMAGYNTEKWSLSAGVLNPFTKKYEQEIENLSKSAPYRQLAYSKNLRLLFMVNASFSLDFGKKRNSQGRRINNRDTDTGILSGSK